LFVRSSRILSIGPRCLKMISNARGGSSSKGNTCEESVPVEETDRAEEGRDKLSGCLELEANTIGLSPPWLEVVLRREEVDTY
jgi:hypothetical protein